MMKEMIYGIHSIENLVKYDYSQFICIYIIDKSNSKRLRLLIQLVERCGITIYKTNRKWLNRITQGAVHQGIVAFIKKKHLPKESDLLDLLIKGKRNFFLILDRVTDPHNFGACFRCASAAGVHAIITPKRNSATLNSTVRKVASGSAEVVPLFRVNSLLNTIKILKKNDIRIIGTSHKSNIDIYKVNLTGPLAFVVGSEYNGIRNLIFKNCDEIISIPTENKILPLNLSVTVGICLFETIRQRKYV